MKLCLIKHRWHRGMTYSKKSSAEGLGDREVTMKDIDVCTRCGVQRPARQRVILKWPEAEQVAICVSVGGLFGVAAGSIWVALGSIGLLFLMALCAKNLP